MIGRELAAYAARRDGLVEAGVDEALAAKVAVLDPSYMLLGVVEIADREQLDAAEVARVHFALGERLGLPTLVGRILQLPRDDRWQTMARAALRDDLYAVHAQLTAQLIAETPGTEGVDERIDAWARGDQAMIDRAADTLTEICADENADLARMSVGLRVVRALLAGG
ncbi:MAG: NAD-glutamate dehydrogenase [Nocardioides sp.]